MSDQWFIARNNKKHGPFTTAKLKELATQGRLSPTDMLLKEGMQKWVAASSVKGLFSVAPARPAATKKPPAPNGGGDFRSNAANSPKARQTQPSSRKKLMILGAAGGGALLLALLVVVLVVAGRGRPPATENAGDAWAAQKEREPRPVVTGKGGSPNAGGRERTEESDPIIRTAPSHILLLDKPARQVKDSCGGLCVFAPDGKSLIVTLNAGNDDAGLPKVKMAVINAEAHELLMDKPPLAEHLVFNDSSGYWLREGRDSLGTLLLASDKLMARQEALEVAMRVKEKNFPLAKTVILAFGTNAEYVAIQGNDRNGQDTSVEIWNLETKTKIVRESPPAEAPKQTPLFLPVVSRQLIFSPDNRLLAQATRNKVQLWELPSGKLVKTLDFERASLLRFSPDGKWLMAHRYGTSNKRVLWNTVDWQTRHTIVPQGELHFDTTLCSFSPDGKWLATVNKELGDLRLITIWEVQTGKLHKAFEGLDCIDLAFSPDGKLLATCGAKKGTDYIWDCETGQAKYQIANTTRFVSFSQDGRFVAATDGGFIYDLTKARQVPFEDKVQKERDRTAKLRTSSNKTAPPKPNNGGGGEPTDKSSSETLQPTQSLEKLIIGKWAQVSGPRRNRTVVEYTDDGKYIYLDGAGDPVRWRYKFIGKDKVQIITGRAQKKNASWMARRSELAVTDHTLTVLIDGEKLTEITELDGRAVSSKEYKRVRKQR